MDRVIWVHEDALGLQDPLMLDQDIPKVFVWDEEYLRNMDYGFQRLVFIYERLCEMQVTVYAGHTVEVFSELLDQDAVVYTAPTPNPELRRLRQQLESANVVHDLRVDPLIHIEREPRLKRFFGFWKKVRSSALEIDGICR